MRYGLADNRGFTIIEVLFTVVLMSILLGIAVPDLRDFHARHELRVAAQQMASNIRGFQQEAWSTRSEGLTPENNSFIVTFWPGIEKYKLERTGNGAWSRVVVFNAGVDLMSTSFKSDKLIIGLSGVSTLGGTVYLQSKRTGDLLHVIVTSRTGRVRVSQKPPEG